MSVVQKSALRREHVSRETFYIRLIQLSAVGERFRTLCRDTACRVRKFSTTKKEEVKAPLKGELAVRSTD